MIHNHLATALTETGSKMDEVIFEEFKGTGNMEQLDEKYQTEEYSNQLTSLLRELDVKVY